MWTTLGVQFPYMVWILAGIHKTPLRDRFHLLIGSAQTGRATDGRRRRMPRFRALAGAMLGQVRSASVAERRAMHGVFAKSQILR